MSDQNASSQDTGNETKADSTHFSYQAEVARVLQLMVHSVYSEKQVFLRELISNASDALDKLRYEALTNDSITSEDELRITIRPDAEAKTITVTDNGIGMTRAEMIDNLGTIARSGTQAFLDQLGSDADGTQLIGQFGVGFYSAFIVAGQVDVISRRAGSDEAHVWSSDGSDGFTLEPYSPGDHSDIDCPTGTQIILHLAEATNQFADAGEIERIVRTYSDNVIFPIYLHAGDDEPRQINSASALWNRSNKEVEAEEYTSFYRQATGQFDEPLHTIHYRAEGRNEYTVLLFIPGMAPFDLYDSQRSGRVKLYVRRVLITDQSDILPPYLRFLRGLIDSQDMPLNLSREMLQNNPVVASIRKAVTNRILKELKEVAEADPEKFITFWKPFGAILKEGIYEDPERRDALFDLVRFRSTRSGKGGEWRSLKEYVADLKENQTAIYHLTGESLEQLRASPQLEAYRAHGVEVLLLDDPIDSFWVTTALGYEGKPFQSVTQGDIDLSNIALDEGAKKPEETGTPETMTALGKMKDILAAVVSDVRASKRLVESPACLIAEAMGPDLGLGKILARQDQGTGMLPILEVNTAHELVQAMAKRNEDSDRQDFEDLAWLLLDQARILDGELPENPVRFAERLNRWVLKSAL